MQTKPGLKKPSLSLSVSDDEEEEKEEIKMIEY